MMKIHSDATSYALKAAELRSSEAPLSKGVIETAKKSKGGDVVEISDAARNYRAGVSAERLAEVRKLIQSGTYVTDEKLDVVVDRLHKELFGPGRNTRIA